MLATKKANFKTGVKEQHSLPSWPGRLTPHVALHIPQHIPQTQTILRAPLKIDSPQDRGGGRGAPWRRRNPKIAMRSNLPFWKVFLGVPGLLGLESLGHTTNC